MTPQTTAFILRLVATIIFVLGIFSVPYPLPTMAMAAAALWCASTLIYPWPPSP